MTTEEPGGGRIPPARVHAFVCEVLQRRGVSAHHAQQTADVLVAADLRGIRSHGVAGGTGLDSLLAKLDAGVVRTSAELVIEQRYPAVLVADARAGLPYPLAFAMCARLREVAAEQGLARGYIVHAGHFGIGGIYTERLAAGGELQARAGCTTAGVVRLLGGTTPRVGTNLVAHTIPYRVGAGEVGYLTVDMATTVHAASWAVKAYKDDQRLAFDYLYYLDARGEPSREPRDFYTGGSVAPLGAAYDERGAAGGVPYKGIILAQMIEADCALAGGRTGAIPLGDANPNRDVSHVFEAQRVDVALERDEALARVQQLVADWRRHGGPETLMPGEREHRRAARSCEEGIRYDEGQLRRLEAIGRGAGVSLE